MVTKPKSNSVVTTALADDRSIEFNVLGVGVIAFDPKKASHECRQRAELHGWTQRIVDAAALSRNPENGQPASPADKHTAMAALVAHYESGTVEWNRKGTGGFDSTGLIVRAVMRVTGKTEEQVREFASMKGEGDVRVGLKLLASAGKVAQAMLDIKREAIRPAVDADAALAELE